MSNIIIGDLAALPVGTLRLHVEILLRTRLLIQAASGQGKSHLIRRLVEQLFGKVQIFVIDHEGEFSTLRPTYDFALIGEGGDAVPDVRTAGLLATRLLELNASTIFDLSEAFRAHPGNRRAWVRAFLTAMMEAPRRLWHPVLVVVDEAHKYCPEKDEAESSEAMTSIATDGRKRQFCAVWATQRLAKLNKDAAAELLNKMIGGTSLDIDRKRAADDLGVYGKALQPFNDEIKVIDRGYFYGLGPAIANSRTLVKVGPTETSPPKLGSRATAPPAPTAAIKKLLPKLADLPKEQANKEASEADLRKRIIELERELRTAKRAAAPATVNEVTIKATPDDLRAELAPYLDTLDKLESARIEKLRHAIGNILDERSKYPSPSLAYLRKAAARVNSKAPEPIARKADPVTHGARIGTASANLPAPKLSLPAGNTNGLKAGARELLKILARRNESVSHDELGVLIGAARRTLSDYLSILRSRGYIEPAANGFTITPEGREVAGPVAPSPATTEEILRMWRPKFKAGAGRILDVLVAAYPAALDRGALMEASQVQATRTFRDYLSELRAARLLAETGGRIAAAGSLFP